MEVVYFTLEPSTPRPLEPFSICGTLPALPLSQDQLDGRLVQSGLLPQLVQQVALVGEVHRVRVIDEDGEDYLYPAEWFVAVELPRAVQVSLLKAS